MSRLCGSGVYKGAWGLRKITQLCLGTVQLGMPYVTKKPKLKDSLEILAFAESAGISCFDTAQAYGTAEEILGTFGMGGDRKVITKLHPDATRVDIQLSLDRLGVSKVFAFLLHRPSHMYSYGIAHRMRELREQGYCDHVGVSVYDKGDAIWAANADWVSAIEFPYNLLCKELDDSPFFDLAAGKVLIARQPFAKGELFRCGMDFFGVNRAQACLQFVMNHIPRFDYVAFGVDDLRQLQENVEGSKKSVPMMESNRIWRESLKLNAYLPPSLWAN